MQHRQDQLRMTSLTMQTMMIRAMSQGRNGRIASAKKITKMINTIMVMAAERMYLNRPLPAVARRS
jgi:hypothetical protein